MHLASLWVGSCFLSTEYFRHLPFPFTGRHSIALHADFFYDHLVELHCCGILLNLGAFWYVFYVRKGWLPLVDKFFVALERDLPVLLIQELLLIKNKILSVSSPATDSREEWAFQRFGFFWSPVNSLKQDTGHFLSPVSYSGFWCSFSSPWWVLLSLSFSVSTPGILHHLLRFLSMRCHLI